MKFTLDSDTLKKAFEKIQVKGKGTTSNGFGNTSLGEYALLSLKENTLSIWNGDATFCVKIEIRVNGEEEGEVTVNVNDIIPYLKTLDEEITFSVGDFISLSSNNRNASVPLVVNHPNLDSLNRLKGLVYHITYEPQIDTLFTFGKENFEAGFTLTFKQLTDCLKACEIVKSGVYKLDYNNNLLTVSSRKSITQKYEETITPVFQKGEPATIEFSSPIYSFFESDQLLNFYMKDEFPLLVVSNDRLLLKAPYING